MKNEPSIESLSTSNDRVLRVVEQFRLRYPTDADCFEKLCEIKGVKIKCKTCGNENIERAKGKRSFVCVSCHKTTWITAGGFFEHTKKTFPWLLLIHLKENGININSNRFSKLAGVASSTAQVMYKKICLVLESYMPEDTVKVSSKDLSILYGKRSIETPAKQHPIFEQLELEKSIYEKRSKQDSENTNNLDEVQERILEFVTDKPIHIDALCKNLKMPVEKVSGALVVLELENLVFSKPGAMYIRNINGSASKLARATVSPSCTRKFKIRIVNFIIREFHRVSRKYIQIYLSAIWCQSNIALWKNGKLLRACQHFGSISKIQIRDYVSATVLKV